MSCRVSLLCINIGSCTVTPMLSLCYGCTGCYRSSAASIAPTYFNHQTGDATSRQIRSKRRSCVCTAGSQFTHSRDAVRTACQRDARVANPILHAFHPLLRNSRQLSTSYSLVSASAYHRLSCLLSKQTREACAAE